MTNKSRGWNHLLCSIDPLRGRRAELQSARTCVRGKNCVRETVIESRKREREGGRAVCVSAHLYSVLVLPLNPCLSPSLYPSSQFIYTSSLHSLAFLGHETGPSRREKSDERILQTRGTTAERKGSELMTHGYWYSHAGADKDKGWPQ